VTIYGRQHLNAHGGIDNCPVDHAVEHEAVRSVQEERSAERMRRMDNGRNVSAELAEGYARYPDPPKERAEIVRDKYRVGFILEHLIALEKNGKTPVVSAIKEFVNGKNAELKQQLEVFDAKQA